VLPEAAAFANVPCHAGTESPVSWSTLSPVSSLMEDLQRFATTLRTVRLVDGGDGVAVVSLASPQTGNALTLQCFDELAALFRRLGGEPDVRCVILNGEGKHFCSGIDLSSFTALVGEQSSDACPGRKNLRLHASVRGLQDAVSALEVCRVPVVCAIQGACLGGAIDLVAAADIRIATRDSVWGVIEADLGFAADLGTLARLPRLVGEGRARELALTCRRFSGMEALAYGLVTTTVDDLEALHSASRALALSLASKSPMAMVATKAELLYARDHSVADALDHVAWRNAATLASEDLQKALAARTRDRKGGGPVSFSKL
jgi:enoyl-CoA hydratase